MSIREEHLEAVAAALKPIIEDTFFNELLNSVTESQSAKSPSDEGTHHECDVTQEVEDALMFADNIQLFTDVPPNAELFYSDNGLSFFRTPNNHIYVTESLSEEGTATEEVVILDRDYLFEVLAAVENLADVLRKCL